MRFLSQHPRVVRVWLPPREHRTVDGGVETLIEQPALMSFHELSSEQRALVGIEENLVRLSVGLEDTDELSADLSRALDAAD